MREAIKHTLDERDGFLPTQIRPAYWPRGTMNGKTFLLIVDILLWEPCRSLVKSLVEKLAGKAVGKAANRHRKVRAREGYDFACICTNTVIG